MIRSTNYVFKKAEELTNVEFETASYSGVGIKTGILLTIAFVTGLISMATPLFTLRFSLLILITTFILSLIISLSPRSARVLSIPYAILEGSLVGAITGVYNAVYTGIASTALLLTIAIFLAGAVLYFTGVIRVTSFFRKFMYVALLGAILGSLFIWIASLFNTEIQNIFYGNTSIAIVLSGIMVILAGLYVVISFDNTTRIVDSGLGKTYEWYAAFGILLNVIWLYLEVLRLVSYFAKRD